MLQRIYGTAWSDSKELENYLLQQEEAEKRDHRKLGRQLDLFHFQEEAPGMVFWHPKGWSIYSALKDFIKAKQDEYDYQEINTPQIVEKNYGKLLVIGISIEKTCLLQRLMKSMQMKRELMP